MFIPFECADINFTVSSCHAIYIQYMLPFWYKTSKTKKQDNNKIKQNKNKIVIKYLNTPFQ